MLNDIDTLRAKFDVFFDTPTLLNARLLGEFEFVEPELFESKEEKDLYRILLEVEEVQQLLYQKKLYLMVLHVATLLIQPTDELFKNLFIKDLEEPRKENLMNMFKRVYTALNMIAEMKKL